MPGSAFDPVRWATSVPLLLRGNGTPDTTAHHVLLVMATFADRDGTNIRPSLETLTRRSHLTKPRTVADALQRLEAAGLILPCGDLNGLTVWRLNLEVRGDEDNVSFEVRRQREREKRAERNRRYRQRLSGRDAPVERPETPQWGVSRGAHQQEETPHSGVPRRRSEASQDAAVRHLKTPPTASHLQLSSGVPALDQPMTNPRDHSGTTYRADADASLGDADPTILDAELVDDEPNSSTNHALFDAGEKPTPAKAKASKKPGAKNPADPEKQERERQAQYLADAYYQAKNRMVKFIGVKQVITRALENYPYATVREGVKRMTTVDRERPFTLDTLRGAIERNNGAQWSPQGGQQSDVPRLSTGDRRLVDGEWLKSSPNWDLLARLGVTPENAHHFGYRPQRSA